MVLMTVHGTKKVEGKLVLGKLTTNSQYTTQLTIPAFSIAALTAIAPSLGAVTLHSELLNDPIGVRTALTITTSYKSNQKNEKYCFSFLITMFEET